MMPPDCMVVTNLFLLFEDIPECQNVKKGSVWKIMDSGDFHTALRSDTLGPKETLMELFLLLLKALFFVVIGIFSVIALFIAVFLWMISTRTKQDSQIFQERFDGWRSSRNKCAPACPEQDIPKKAG